MRYCAANPASVENVGVPADSLKPAPHPITGAPGCWVASKFLSQVESAGFELWPEPTTYMMVHLEAVLRKHLGEFVDIQETARWLANAPEQMAELVKEAIPNVAARLKLTQVLRGLVEEGVPILNHALILESLLKAQGDQDYLTTAGEIRLQLKTKLPGNDPITQQIALPTDVESKIAAGLTGTGAKRCLALTPEETQDVLAAVRELIPSDKPGWALTVQRTEVRPFVRKLVHLEWPSLAVLAKEELTHDSVNLPQRVAEPPEAIHA
jgi:type III secretory pathway component EscV